MHGNIENVNHPSHYTDGSIEVWDFTGQWRFDGYLFSVVKYVSRAGKKNDEVEDLRKAKAFLEKKIKTGDFEELQPMNKVYDAKTYSKDKQLSFYRYLIIYCLCEYKKWCNPDYLIQAVSALEKEIEAITE